MVPAVARIPLQILLLLTAAWQSGADRWTGKAESPVDGDTLRVRDSKDVVRKIRILGIDAPEEGQPFFRAAREHLADVTREREVEVTEVGTDSAGRTVGRVRINGHDLAIDMLAAGLAWYHRSTVEDPALHAEERRARARNLGLWIDTNPTAPWDWRAAEEKRRRERRAKKEAEKEAPPVVTDTPAAAPTSPEN